MNNKNKKIKINGDQALKAEPRVKPFKPSPEVSTWNSSIAGVLTFIANTIIATIDTIAPMIFAKSGPMN